MIPTQRRPLPAAFAGLWAAQLLALLGKRGSRFALLWWLGQGPDAAVHVAAAAWFALLPTVVLGPLVGVLVDRVARARAMRMAEGLQAVATSLLLVLVVTTDAPPLAVVFAFVLASGLAAVVLDAAFNASMPLMLRDRTLLRVQGANQSLYHGLDLAAAPLGVLVLETTGLGGVLGAHLALSGATLAVLGRLRIPSPTTPPEPGTWRAHRRAFAAGVAALRRSPGVATLVALFAAANLAAVPAGSLVAVLVDRHFGGGPVHFSQMEVANGAGVLAGGAALALWGGVGRPVLAFRPALVILAASLLGVGLLPPGGFPIAVAATFMAGLCAPLLVASLLAHLQLAVPVEAQGRVFTLVGAIVLLPTLAALPAAGALADRLGVTSVYRLAGAALLAVALLALARRERRPSSREAR